MSADRRQVEIVLEDIAIAYLLLGIALPGLCFIAIPFLPGGPAALAFWELGTGVVAATIVLHKRRAEYIALFGMLMLLFALGWWQSLFTLAQMIAGLLSTIS